MGKAALPVAIVILLLATVVMAYTFWPPKNPGTGKPAIVTCPAGHVTNTTWDTVIVKGANDPGGGGWVMPCPVCNAPAKARDPAP